MNVGSTLRLAEKLLQQLFVLLAFLATMAGIMIVTLVCASVAMRHLAHAPFRFTEELVGLLMTAAFFLALPLVTFRAEHVRVQIVINAMPVAMAKGFSIVAGLFGVAFTVWFFWLCVPWFEFAYQRNIKTEVGRLLMYPWMVVLPLSMLLTAVAFAMRVVRGNTVDEPGGKTASRER